MKEEKTKHVKIIKVNGTKRMKAQSECLIERFSWGFLVISSKSFSNESYAFYLNKEKTLKLFIWRLKEENLISELSEID